MQCTHHSQIMISCTFQIFYIHICYNVIISHHTMIEEDRSRFGPISPNLDPDFQRFTPMSPDVSRFIQIVANLRGVHCYSKMGIYAHTSAASPRTQTPTLLTPAVHPPPRSTQHKKQSIATAYHEGEWVLPHSVVSLSLCLPRAGLSQISYCNPSKVTSKDWVAHAQPRDNRGLWNNNAPPLSRLKPI